MRCHDSAAVPSGGPARPRHGGPGRGERFCVLGRHLRAVGRRRDAAERRGRRGRLRCPGGPPGPRPPALVAGAGRDRHGRLVARPVRLVLVPADRRARAAVAVAGRRRVPELPGVRARRPVRARPGADPARPRALPARAVDRALRRRGGARRPDRHRLAVHPHLDRGARAAGPGHRAGQGDLGRRHLLPAVRPGDRGRRGAAGGVRPGGPALPHEPAAGRGRDRRAGRVRQRVRLPGQHRRGEHEAVVGRRVRARAAVHRVRAAGDAGRAAAGRRRLAGRGRLVAAGAAVRPGHGGGAADHRAADRRRRAGRRRDLRRRAGGVPGARPAAAFACWTTGCCCAGCTRASSS